MSTATYEILLYEAVAETEGFVLGSGRLGFAALGVGVADPISPSLILTDFTSLNCVIQFNQVSYHHIRFDLSGRNPQIQDLRNISEDSIINVWRYDPVLDRRDMVYAGFNRTVVDQVRIDGTYIINLYGSGYTDLLKRRIVIPAAGEESSDKIGFAETIMKEYVAEQASVPANISRTIPGLTIEADQGIETSASYSARYTNLYTVIANIATQGSVDFAIEQDGDAPGTFEFRVRRPYGLDRRVNNLDGNTPAIFSIDLGNMIIPIQSYNSSEEINVVYVGGAGQGADRDIEEVRDDEAIARSSWNRREVFVSADEDTDLTTTGVRILRENRTKNDITFNVQNTENSRWLRDWNLGDIITAMYGNQRFIKQITEINLTVTGGGENRQSHIETINVELSDYPHIFWRIGEAGYSEIGETTIVG